MMRPRGTPPTPIAASSESDVVDIAGISETSRSPRRMIDPLPNLFSILSSAASMARLRSDIRSSDMVDISFFCSSSGLDSVVSQEISSRNETEDNTTPARMEQSFMYATRGFPEGRSFGARASAALSALSVHFGGIEAARSDFQNRSEK